MNAAPNTGRIGEALLLQWGAEAGLIVNRAGEDASGWDFLVEWPVLAAADYQLTLDRTEGPLQCLVQVKTTRRDNARWQVKLSNWLRFISTPLPSFFLLVQLGEDARCIAAHIVHVDETWIRKVLLKLRKLGTAGAELHRRSVSIHVRHGSPINELSGDGLAGALAGHVTPSLGPYISEKRQWLKEIGYEDGSGTFNIHFPLPESHADSQEVLVDLDIGLLPELVLSGGNYVDTRFGIPAPTPDFEIPDGARLSIQSKNSTPGKVVIEPSSGASRDVLPCEVYFPSGVASVVSRSALKVRFALPFLDIVWRPWGVSKVAFKMNLAPAREDHDLIDFHAVSTVISFLEKSAGPGALPVMHLFMDDTRVASGSFGGAPLPPRPFRDLAGAAAGAYAVARRYSIDRDIRTSIRELMRQRPALRVLDSVLSMPPDRLRFSFWLEDHPSDTDAEWCIPGAVEVTLGTYRLQVSWALFGPLEEIVANGQERRYELTGSRIKIHHENVLMEKDIPERTIHELIEELTGEYDRTHNVVNPVGFF